MNQQPKISIVTPSFNQGEFIKDTIESVLAQNYQNFEHIVVDGGSTDNTIDILKSYKHLIWTSEPDNGQTDALNKGLSKATGDIVTWLNSDDWYEPNIFRLVADELKSSHIIMGACNITDRKGKVDYTVLNVPRSWFDLLKYWCSYSIPTQPSIFFRRSVLEEIRRSDGKFLDEELYYCMDYDLWMRIWSRHVVKQIPRVFCYYRMYEDNKTGQGNEPLMPEMSRIFSRYSHASNIVERSFSFVIPVAAIDNQLQLTLESLSNQTMNNFEVLLVDYSQDRAVAKSARKLLGSKEGKLGQIGARLRYVKCYDRSFGAALNSGAQSCASLYMALLQPGATISENFVSESIKIFGNDRVASIIPGGDMAPLAAHLRAKDGQLAVDNLFSTPYPGITLVIRKVALQDVGWFKSPSSLAALVRQLLVNLVHKGWNLNFDNLLSVSYRDDFSTELKFLIDNEHIINSNIIVGCAEEVETNPFSKMRLDHGYALNFQPTLVHEAKAVLRNSPQLPKR